MCRRQNTLSCSLNILYNLLLVLICLTGCSLHLYRIQLVILIVQLWLREVHRCFSLEKVQHSLFCNIRRIVLFAYCVTNNSESCAILWSACRLYCCGQNKSKCGTWPRVLLSLFSLRHVFVLNGVGSDVRRERFSCHE